jgi:bifunctional enzyme CysN/CysC
LWVIESFAGHVHRKAESGKINNVTGRDQPYEPPEEPAPVLRTAELDAQAAADRVFRLVLAHV